jgi:hypothetical protein
MATKRSGDYHPRRGSPSPCWAQCWTARSAPAFVSAHDSWSLLSLGPQGWIHISVLVVTRALVVHGALLLIAGV